MPPCISTHTHNILRVLSHCKTYTTADTIQYNTKETELLELYAQNHKCLIIHY